MRRFQAPTQEQVGALIAMLAVMFGGWVRLMIPGMAGFPVNDGGLFYVMLRAVQANGLRIPATVHYNGLDIPFAYPPLGFYAGALTMNVFRVDAITVLQWLPAVVLVATLPAFYVLAKAVLATSFRAGLATLIFAFAPRAITWQIMGGGLTRSFGQLFMILAWAFIYLTFAKYGRKNLLLAVVFSGLVVLSHPEDALQTAGIAVLLWLFVGRTKHSALHALAIGVGTLAVSAVWWLPLALGGELQSLLAAGLTGMHTAVALLAPFLFNFVEEPLATIVAVLGMIGFALECARRRFLIPLWFFLPWVIEPRSAATTDMVPLALLAGLTLADVLLPALSRFEKGPEAAESEGALRGRAAPLFLLFLGFYLMGASALFDTQVAATALPRGTREGFDWVKENTPPESRFLVLSGNSAGEFFCDAPVEWFPALAERTSLTTIQGREWLPGGQFHATLAVGQRAAGCMYAEDPAVCLDGLTAADGRPVNYDYLFISRSMPVVSGCRAIASASPGESLIETLKATPGYSVSYENDAVAVFKLR